MQNPIELLREMGHEFRTVLPERTFERVKIVGDIAYLAAHGASDENGRLVALGRVGEDVALEDAQRAAERVAVNCLGTLHDAIGDLDRVEEIIKVAVYVNCSPSFFDLPAVSDSFTRLMLAVLGDRGRHVRSTVGVRALPRNQTVEAEVIARVRTT